MTLFVGGPILLIGFVGGVLVSVLQILTSMQDPAFNTVPRLLIFGRRKLSTMVLVGSVISWSGELLLRAATDDRYVPWQGFTLVTLMVPALLANDAQRQGLERTAWGAAITTLTVFGTMALLAGALRVAGFDWA